MKSTKVVKSCIGSSGELDISTSASDFVSGVLLGFTDS